MEVLRQVHIVVIIPATMVFTIIVSLLILRMQSLSD